MYPARFRVGASMLSILTAASVMTHCSGLTAPVLAANHPPNIVFIIADDLGYGDLGCYGQRQIQTPNIDRLAREGLRFTSFYAGSTVCAPSRCVLMTGFHTGHPFIRGNGKDNLRPQDVTVAELLRDAGYATGIFGKWGLGHEGSTGIPTRKGFGEFFGYLDQHHAHNYYPSFLVRNESRVSLKNVVPGEGEWGQGVAAKKVEYSHDLISKEALAFIDRNKDRPFFLYLAWTIPHANNEAGKKGMEVPDYGIYANRDWPEPQQGHAAMITRMDADVGRLLELLAKRGVDDNTIVFFTSDNGPHREGGNDPDFNDSNGPLRGIKRDLTEGGIRVPMIVRWPGRIRRGTNSEFAGAFWDVMPTLAELAGTGDKVPKETDGLSFVPTLLGRGEKQRHHDNLYWAFYEGGGGRALRMGQWKAIQQPIDAPVRLYDLKSDLGENRDVASEHSDLVARLVSQMDNAYTPSERWKFPQPRKGKPARQL
jgi:arylsulfatase A-like enzyme